MQQIWVAVISGLCVAVPSVMATISSNKRNNDLVLYRIGELEKKQQKHQMQLNNSIKLINKIVLIII